MRIFSLVMLIFVCVLFAGCSSKVKNASYCEYQEKFQRFIDGYPRGQESFSMTVQEKKPASSASGFMSSFPQLVCKIEFHDLVPGDTYCLYCPNTGDVEYPESQLCFFYSAKGEILGIAEDGYMWKVDSIERSLPAIPGFTSDWYLFQLKMKSSFHLKMQSKPIVAKGDDGKEIRIEKKESGGNMLFVKLSGFKPKENILFYSNSEGEVLPIRGCTDEHGVYSYCSFPQVNGKKKGVVTISLSKSTNSLQASCDWDRETLEIVRKQPDSFIYKICRSIGSK